MWLVLQSAVQQASEAQSGTNRINIYAAIHLAGCGAKRASMIEGRGAATYNRADFAIAYV